MVIIYRQNFETDEELYEPYVVKTAKRDYYKLKVFNQEVRVPFLRVITMEDELDEMEEDNERMINLKIRVLNDRIEDEKNNQLHITNLQHNNFFRIVASCLCTVIMLLIIFIIDQFVHISWYLSIEDISITDLKSVGALFFVPLVLVLIVAIIINTGWAILMLKRIYVVEDPHDHIRKNYDAVIRLSKERVKVYEDRIVDLRKKMIELGKS